MPVAPILKPHLYRAYGRWYCIGFGASGSGQTWQAAWSAWYDDRLQDQNRMCDLAEEVMTLRGGAQNAA